jgi:2'-hydroxyisoflavone reductase
VQFIDVRDLAAWILLALEYQYKGVYNATGPEKKLTIRELLEACRQESKSDAKLVWVDYKFLEKQKIDGWSDMPVWVAPTPDNLGFSSLNCKKAIDRGLVFRPVGDTVKDTIAWYEAEPEERRKKKMRAGVAPEREAEVLAAWLKKLKAPVKT